MDENHLRYEGWRVAAASTIGLFFWSLPPYSFAVFLKPIAEDLGLSRQAVSSMFGAAALMVACSGAFVGYLIDRVGGRAVVIPALAVAGCAFALRVFLAPPLWPFMLLFALSGLAGVGSSPVAYARLLSTWFDRRRGLALGVAIAGGGLGAIVHPPAADALIRAFGWRSAHVVLGGLIVLIGVPVVARFVRARSVPRSARAGVDTTAAGASVREGVSSPVFWVLVVALLCDSITNGSLAVHLSALLTDRGITAGDSAMALSVMGAAALVGRLSTGWLMDRFFGPRVSCGLLLATSAGTLLLSGTSTLSVALVGAALVGFGMGGESDVTPYLLSRYFGLRSFSTLYGMSYIAVGLAWAIGPVLMGRTFDTTGTYEPHLLRLVVALVGAAGLMLTLPRYTTPMVRSTEASGPPGEASRVGTAV